MLKTSWVELLSDGRRVVDELRRQNFPIKAAFWYYFEEARQWRLVIISSHVQTEGPRSAYRKLVDALAYLQRSGQPVGITIADIQLLGEESLIFKHVRDEVYGRGSNQGTVENFELDDAYVYMI